MRVVGWLITSVAVTLCWRAVHERPKFSRKSRIHIAFPVIFVFIISRFLWRFWIQYGCDMCSIEVVDREKAGVGRDSGEASACRTQRTSHQVQSYVCLKAFVQVFTRKYHEFYCRFVTFVAQAPRLICSLWVCTMQDAARSCFLWLNCSCW